MVSPSSSSPSRLSDRLFGARGGSISNKILTAFLLVSIFGMLAIIVMAELMFQGIIGVTEQSNLSIGEAAAQRSDEALTATVLSNTEQLALAKAAVIDESLKRLSGDLVTLANYINGLYAHPEDYRAAPFDHVRVAPTDVLTLQWALSPNMPGMVSPSRFDERDLEDAGVLDETWLLGNIEHAGGALMADESHISSIYLTTSGGINIGYDSFAQEKRAVDTIDLRERDWYVGARDNDGIYLSNTYRDSFDRGLNITMSMPVKGPDGVFKGVVGIDINISDLDDIVTETVASSNGYAVLLNGGEIISAPGLDEGNENDLTLFLGSEAHGIIERMRGDFSDSGETRVGADAREFFAVWAPVTTTKWQLVILVPKLDIVAPSVELHSEISTMADEAASFASNRIMVVHVILIGIAALLVAGSIITSRYISLRITRPITRLSADVDRMATGTLDYRSDITTGDEIEALSHSFENMTRQLKGYIAEINQATAEKERISTELNVAANIQAAMLPNTFPPFPGRDEFDIFATMQPAREVGGDFYDFFFIDERRLAVVIADVSGKGIPAALFMVVAKTLIKSSAQMGTRPAEVFEAVNDLLAENNDAGMFVTAFMGYLDVESGMLTCVNAGHNPPCLGCGGGGFAPLAVKPGFVLGGFSGMRYKEHTFVLKPGATLFLYTDGVTEATSPALELFSEKRLVATLNRLKDVSINDLVRGLVDDIEDFSMGAEQADDITMLVLRTNTPALSSASRRQKARPAKTTSSPIAPEPELVAPLEAEFLDIDARDTNLPKVLDFVCARLRAAGFGERQLNRVALAVEEVFVNIAHYAYGGAVGLATIRVSADGQSGTATIEMCDRGSSFNPLAKPDPDLALSAQERAVGGLGVFMARQIVDEISYRREDGMNRLLLTVTRNDNG
jgi:sigma-B regulation protein RsbU (phosphoserine phosphatase)